ncbi:hypothetical protein ScPMuIL_013938 [Solemya velum]
MQNRTGKSKKVCTGYEQSIVIGNMLAFGEERMKRRSKCQILQMDMGGSQQMAELSLCGLKWIILAVYFIGTDGYCGKEFLVVHSGHFDYNSVVATLCGAIATPVRINIEVVFQTRVLLINTALYKINPEQNAIVRIPSSHRVPTRYLLPYEKLGTEYVWPFDANTYTLDFPDAYVIGLENQTYVRVHYSIMGLAAITMKQSERAKMFVLDALKFSVVQSNPLRMRFVRRIVSEKPIAVQVGFLQLHPVRFYGQRYSLPYPSTRTVFTNYVSVNSIRNSTEISVTSRGEKLESHRGLYIIRKDVGILHIKSNSPIIVFLLIDDIIGVRPLFVLFPEEQFSRTVYYDPSSTDTILSLVVKDTLVPQIEYNGSRVEEITILHNDTELNEVSLTSHIASTSREITLASPGKFGGFVASNEVTQGMVTTLTPLVCDLHPLGQECYLDTNYEEMCDGLPASKDKVDFSLPSPKEESEFTPAEEDLNISLDPPSKEEMRKAIKTLNKGKSGGPDCISTEVLTSALETSVTILHPLLQQIWEKETIPADWKEG